MGLTEKKRQAAFAYGCTHAIRTTATTLVRRNKVNIYEFGELAGSGAEVSAWRGTPDLEVSDLAPINWLGGNYDRDDIGYQVKLCPVPVLEAMATELHSYGATRQAPVTQEHADCWGVTLDQVWEWVMPAYGAAVRAGYKSGSKVGV